jgi:type VI secretion system protein ImpF
MRTRNANRVQPSLLECLTDHAPDAKKDIREHRSNSARTRRLSVMRDLGWLFNARGIGSVQDIARYPYVAGSVLNFGFADLTGKCASEIEVARLERQMSDAIITFEPRIVPNTLRVRAIQSEGAAIRHNAITFAIEGHLHASPVPEWFCLRTEFDFEAGKASVCEGTVLR